MNNINHLTYEELKQRQYDIFSKPWEQISDAEQEEADLIEQRMNLIFKHMLEDQRAANKVASEERREELEIQFKEMFFVRSARKKDRGVMTDQAIQQESQAIFCWIKQIAEYVKTKIIAFYFFIVSSPRMIENAYHDAKSYVYDKCTMIAISVLGVFAVVVTLEFI